jgi:hypothetical protein
VQPLLQELGKQNPQVMQLIQENQAEFMRLINEPLEGDEDNEMFAPLLRAAPAFSCAIRIVNILLLPEPGTCWTRLQMQPKPLLSLQRRTKLYFV